MAEDSNKLTAIPVVKLDDLLGLVAGTLEEENFKRISRAVAQDPVLRQNLEQLEHIREGVLRLQAQAQNLDAIDAAQANVLGVLAEAAANRIVFTESCFWKNLNNVTFYEERS